MKENELMIRDWVQVPSELNRYKRISSTFDMDSAILYEPIPLTPEILEKNEFALEHYSGDVMTGYWWTRNDFVIHNSMNDAIGKNNFKYEYVHQLQHALRLCGINKEIEL